MVRKFLTVGEKLGRVTVVASPSSSSIIMSDLLCECGTIWARRTNQIKQYPPKGCPPCAYKGRPSRARKFLTPGQLIGSLTVVASPSVGDDKSLSDLVCICGRQCSRKTYKLKHRGYGTCGCRQKTAMVPVGEKIGQFTFMGECRPIDRQAIGKHGIFVCHCGRENVASFASVAAGRKRCRCTPHPKKKPEGVAELNTVWSSYRSVAMKKGREFSLTIEQFSSLVLSDCHYCGDKPAVRSRDTVRTGIRQEVRRKWASRSPRNGVDRVDSKRGYVDGNVVPCCPACNTAKSAMTRDEFITWIDRAASHLGVGRGWVAA